jgi:glycosyltransferase involved in cell wall biosynthesis
MKPESKVLPTVTLVIPALNEAQNLPWVLSRIPSCVSETILVDGDSTDATVEVALSVRPGIRILRQPRRGKGSALAMGFAAARSDIIVTLDADGSMDPAEIERFVSGLVTTESDYAKGSRFLHQGGSEDLTRLRKVGNFCLRALVNLLYGTTFSDLCYGFNAVRRTELSKLGLSDPELVNFSGQHSNLGNGFEIETCLNIRAARAGLKILEVPSYERVRRFGKSNLRTFRDGVRVLRAIVAERRVVHPIRTLPFPTANDAVIAQEA